MIFLFPFLYFTAHLFLISLDRRLGCLSEVFSVYLFLEVAVSLITSLSEPPPLFFGFVPKILESCVSIFSHVTGLT